MTSAVDALPDLVPPKTDTQHTAGNHVVIEHQAVKILLAHMHNGSVLANVGDRLLQGQPLGKVGNSGNTSEPHLHIHAERGGLGIPILFEEKFLVCNSLVVAPKD